MNKHRAYFLLLLPDMCVNLFPGIYSFLFLRTSLLVLLDENTENKKIGSFGLVSGEMRFFFLCFDGFGVEMNSTGSRYQRNQYQRMLLIR